ncbi:hypothetical protein DLM77_21140 [Leptospira yasudae]|uniref:Hint domain-containing protein n=1 Tax=Leptospira yasudae TaxID=2202201 RepID=A0ABX9LXC2_9LEPT|nr:hypothetical protein DLM77_21140 [Leptospira yasudae]
MGSKIILTVTLLSFNLLTGAESAFSGKRFETPSLFFYPTFQNDNIFSPRPAPISRLFNYEAGSGNYTASGGFNIYGDAGLSISAGKDGYASFGLNYNKDGKGWLNNLSGVGLTMGSDGVFTLSHQFKGSDTLNLSYNTNTHGFSPIGVNGNFINDLNLSLIQEHAAKGNADAIKKLADYYGNVLVERGVISAEKMGELMTKSGGHEELISLYDSNKQAAFANGENSPEAIKWKSETTQAVEQLRSEGLNITMGGQSQSGGFFNDLFTSFQNSMGNATNGNGGFDTNGDFSINTCFTAGTLVHTKNGLKKIEEIGIGDQVLSWDEESGEQSYKTVTELFVHEINHLYDVEVNGIEVFHTTWNHPFWVVNERSWVKVKDLKVGDIVQLKDGSQVPITGITPYSLSMTPVYNLEVEENHTYYVGKDGVLVHNYDPTSMALAKQYARSLSDQKLLDACSSSACKQQVSNEINAGLELGFKGLPLPADASEAVRKGYSDGLADRAENQAKVITGTGLVGVGLAAWLPQALLPTAISLSDKIPLLGRMLGLSPSVSANTSLIGKEFGKLGKVVENPRQVIIGLEPSGHAAGRIAERGLNNEIILNTVENATVVLKQSSGGYLYITDKAAVVLNSSGQIVTGYLANRFDASMQAILNLSK